MKFLMMIIGALVMFAAGGGGAYFYFQNQAIASAPEGEEHELKKEKKKEGKEASANFDYVELEPLILPIVDKNGVSQVVSMVIALEVKDISVSDEVRRLEPRLKDAYIQDLYGVLNEHAALKGGVIQVAYLKKRLNKISYDVLGNETVNDVLLQVVQQRPL